MPTEPFDAAVVDGEWAFVSGTTGFDYATMTISPDVGEQTRQALENIASAAREVGFSLADVVRTVYILPRAEDFHVCWPVLREYLGEVRPVSGLGSKTAVAEHDARHRDDHERHRRDDRQRGDIGMERCRHHPGGDQPAHDARAVADEPVPFIPHVRATTPDAGNLPPAVPAPA
jgi:enamine deaminase RidA (YjgF/YER057c/UK114 family)